jgi:hypothetical protein
LVIVFQSHNIIFAEIVAELYFDERERLVGRVAEAMLSLRGDVDVLARFELQLAVAADDISDALNDDPVFAPTRMLLKA